jgi:hypothetical protein
MAKKSGGKRPSMPHNPSNMPHKPKEMPHPMKGGHMPMMNK